MLTTTLAVTLWLAGAAAGVPVDAAENQRPAPSRGGVVAADVDGNVSVQSLLLALKADATRRHGAGATVAAVQEVVWSDGALGCPQPGMSYTQALVPGWRVRIEAGGTSVTYHASRRGQWLACPAGRAVAPLPGEAVR